MKRRCFLLLPINDSNRILGHPAHTSMAISKPSLYFMKFNKGTVSRRHQYVPGHMYISSMTGMMLADWQLLSGTRNKNSSDII